MTMCAQCAKKTFKMPRTLTDFFLNCVSLGKELCITALYSLQQSFRHVIRNASCEVHSTLHFPLLISLMVKLHVPTSDVFLNIPINIHLYYSHSVSHWLLLIEESIKTATSLFGYNTYKINAKKKLLFECLTFRLNLCCCR